MRILLIEDNIPLAERTKGVLTDAGFAVDLAADGEKGRALGESQSYDAALLDLGLPKLPGLEVLKRWRASGRDFPVIIVTGRIGWRDRVVGLNAGADDYIEKPFEPAELVARLRSALRRACGKSHPVLSHTDIEVDATCGVVRKAGENIELTALELRILSYLMHRPERIVSQNELMDHIYSIDTMRDSNTATFYLFRLLDCTGAATGASVRLLSTSTFSRHAFCGSDGRAPYATDATAPALSIDAKMVQTKSMTFGKVIAAILPFAWSCGSPNGRGQLYSASNTTWRPSPVLKA
jgi:two-component system OmpR family response regulator